MTRRLRYVDRRRVFEARAAAAPSRRQGLAAAMDLVRSVCVGQPDGVVDQAIREQFALADKLNQLRELAP